MDKICTLVYSWRTIGNNLDFKMKCKICNKKIRKSRKSGLCKSCEDFESRYHKENNELIRLTEIPFHKRTNKQTERIYKLIDFKQSKHSHNEI